MKEQLNAFDVYHNTCFRQTRQVNQGRFGPIPVGSGCFGPGCFGPISGESRLPNWGGSFPPSFKGGLFRPYLRGESFRPDLFISGTHVRY